MIQDIFPLQLENQYRAGKPEPTNRVMVFRANEILVKEGDALDFPTYRELAAAYEEAARGEPEVIYLFAIGKTAYFLCWEPAPRALEALLSDGHAFLRMSGTRIRQPKEQVFAAATAWHLAVWYRDNRYCGRCGTTLIHSGELRMLSCPSCSNMVFPKIAPAVIVAVTDKERILMTKYAGREYKRYALIAGFTEIGETAEETVRREVFEEVGLRVKNIRYYKSQPWGYDANLLLGYFCELDGDDMITLDEGELAVAEWVHYRDIEDDEEGLSLTREMMTVFRDSKKTDLG